MTVDRIQAIVDRAIKAMCLMLHESGCARLDEGEIEKVEEIIVSSLAKSGALNI